AEAQRWFHYIFDPTASDGSANPSLRFWRFLAFRQPQAITRIEDIVRLLSTPAAELSDADKKAQEDVMHAYDAIRNKPFHPYAAAATRQVAHQYSVGMKYLDNL